MLTMDIVAYCQEKIVKLDKSIAKQLLHISNIIAIFAVWVAIG